MLLKYLYAFLISMTPIIELRGAIPVAIGMGLDPIPTLLVCIVGNMVPVPFIFFFGHKLLLWGSRKENAIGRFCNWCLSRGQKGSEQLKAKGRNGLYIALLLFVGIPIPGTGAWMGTFAASLLNMNFKKSFFYVLVGDALAGVLVLLASMGVFGAIAHV